MGREIRRYVGIEGKRLKNQTIWYLSSVCNTPKSSLAYSAEVLKCLGKTRSKSRITCRKAMGNDRQGSAVPCSVFQYRFFG